MYSITLLAGFSLGLLAAGPACTCGPATPAASPQTTLSDANDVHLVVKNLQEKATRLQSFQARLAYVVKQPWLESQLRRKGTLSYAKLDDKSSLRINFRTLQQDEEPEQPYLEQFLFDGVWLWHIDYQTERVERRQMAEPNQPIDAFALAGKHVPVLGFSKVEDLYEQFEIALVSEAQDSARHHLHLKVKPNSAYKDDYTTIDLWVNKKLGLPSEIVAVNTEDDVHEIALLDPKINDPIDKAVFRVDVPSGFSVDVIPLKKTTQTK